MTLMENKIGVFRTYDEEWFRKISKKSFKQIKPHVWIIDSLSMWSPEGVRVYNNLQKNSGYRDNLTSEEGNLIKKKGKDLSNILPKKLTMIDMGPGIGEKSIAFIKILENYGKEISYIGIDVSGDMAKLLRKNLRTGNIKGKILCSTFYEGLKKLRKIKSPKIITFFGLTVFSQGMDYLNWIKKNLSKDDFAFFTMEPREKIDLKRIRESYLSKKAIPFHEATLKLLRLRLGEEVNNLEVNDEISVYVTVKRMNSFLTRKGVKLGDKIRIGFSYRPRLVEIIKNLEESGFEANVLDNGENFVGILMFRKKHRVKKNLLNVPNLGKNHLFRKHFEGKSGKEAFNRMVSGSLELLPYLKAYLSKGQVLEVGPFYDPLVNKKNFPKVKITYLDRDKEVLNYLKKKGISTIHFNFGVSKSSLLKSLPKQDAVVTSHIINHIGLPNMVNVLKKRIKNGGYFFMNESIEYGGKGLMHKNRPKNIEEILEYLRKNNFDIVVYRIIPSPNIKFQPNPRIILVARKNH